MKNETQPVFFKARPVPYFLKSKLAKEILNFKQIVVSNFVQHSSWTTPFVIIPKKNSNVRLRGDLIVIVFKFINQNQYLFPTQQDLFATLNGGQCFSKLDFRHLMNELN